MHFQTLESRRFLSAVLMGDANADGRIDGSDYSLIDNGFMTQAKGWSNGDFNGDGVINGSDYSLIDNAFNRQDAAGKTYSVRPGDNLTTALSALKPGDTLNILPGTYHGSINFSKSGTASAPITINGFGTDQTVLDAVGLSSNFTSTGQYVNFNGITFNGATNALQTGGVTISNHTNMNNCIVQNCDAAGLNIQGSNDNITGVILQNNGEVGFKSAYQSNITLTNVITRNNNYGMTSPSWAGKANTLQVGGKWYVSPQFETGGGKFANSSNITVDGMQSYGNTGHGLDFDINNYAVTVKNSTFHDEKQLSASYEAMGISVEISYGPTIITNNTFSNDAGGGVNIQVSTNATITGNTFTSANLNLTNWSRGSGYDLKNITIQNNTLSSSQLTCFGDLHPWDTTSTSVMSLNISNNTWQSVPSIAVQWGNTPYSLANAKSKLGIS